MGEYLNLVLPNKRNNHECDCLYIINRCELCPLNCEKDEERGKFKDLPISKFIPDYLDRIKNKNERREKQ